MPCADGELCHQPDKTPQAPHGHVCHGGCGGRLHGNCGSMVGDIETRRICCSCVSGRPHGNCGSMVGDIETRRICGSCVARAGKRKEIPADGGGGENTGRERRGPPAYSGLSPHFGVLESAADESGNGDAAFHLQKAKMAMIAAHAAKRVRQADMREFVET
ncbi:unnamed protein product [Ectocarpus sp. CCAP 1310/34]|nr:unnamed protein product [Ectocarpus sp. CCAP 1310/34]